MKRKRHSEEQIIRILREAEATEVPVVEVIKEHGISDQTFYRWKKQCGRMDVADEAPEGARPAKRGVASWRSRTRG